MSNSSDGKTGNRVLTIPVGDRVAFENACADATISEVVRVAVVHLSGRGGITVESTVEPGMPAILAAVQAPVVAALTGQIDDRLLELALAADIRVCDAGTTFALTQVSRSELPSDGGTQRLPRIVGSGFAADMLLTGRRITAQEALGVGLVTEIVVDGTVAGRATEIAGEISKRGKAAGNLTKEAVLKGADMPLDQAVRLEADLAILLHTDPERSEGIDAFKTRREPDYQREPGFRRDDPAP